MNIYLLVNCIFLKSGLIDNNGFVKKKFRLRQIKSTEITMTPINNNFEY